MADDANEPQAPVIGERTAVVATSNGPVRGYVEAGIQAFKGLRYGAPPIGGLRFRPPARPAPWTAVADAVALGAPAIQMGLGPTPPNGRNPGLPDAPGEPEASEDCLFINLWSPGLGDGGRRPVMVWLHGGGYANGSGGAAMYDGAALARKGDVVVVTVNHRLNVFGFLHLGEIAGPAYAQSGMAGMLDIVQVLEWVRDNIEAFGGDPANVTVFGESGGGMKVSILMAMPAARGLFHKAVVQSGPGLRVVGQASATAVAKAVLGQFAPEGLDLAALQAASTEAILAAAEPVQARLNAEAPLRVFSPVADGVALPADPFHPTAPALSADVPLLIGSNKDETTLFMLRDPKFGSLTEADLAKRAKAAAGAKAEVLVAAFRRLHPDHSPTHLLSDVTTAVGIWADSITQAERKAAQGAAPVFMYQLAWETPVARGRLKSPHALEIPLVFDNVENARSFVGRGDEPQVLADQMSAAWLAFARSGDPGWPAYDSGRRATWIFDLDSRLADDPNGEIRAILQS